MRNKSATTPDQALARVATRQYGVISAAQLVSLGVGRWGIQRRVEAGRLHRVHRAVYAVGHPRLSNEGRWMAAVLAGGEGAALSHRDGAALLGIRPAPSGPVEITVPGENGRSRRPRLIVHRSRTLSPNDVTERRGIPVTTPRRTIDDLRRVLPTDQFQKALRQAEVLRLDVGKQPDFEPDRARSDLERLFLALCRRHKLPTPEVNAQVGSFEADFLWRERSLIVEIDSYHYHGTRSAFEADRARDAQLKLLGYDVIRLTDRQLTDHADTSLTTVRDLLAGANLL